MPTRRWTLTHPRGGVVVLDQKLLLPVLPLNRPVRPQQRLVTVHAIRKDFVEDGSNGLLVDHWQAIAPARAGPNIEQHVVRDSTGTDVRPMKVQICRTRPVEAVRWIFKKWSTRRWIGFTRHSTWIGVALPKGRGLIAGLTVFRTIQRIREVVHVYVVQERDLDRISDSRAKRWARTRDAMSLRPHGSAKGRRSEEHTSELQSRGLISYAVF